MISESVQVDAVPFDSIETVPIPYDGSIGASQLSFVTVTIIFVMGFMISGIWYYGGTPKKILIHLHEMGSHTFSQNFYYKTEDNSEDKVPRVRTLRPPPTHKSPIIEC